MISTAPKHRASHPQHVTLRLLDDIVPMRTDERSMSRHEAIQATGGTLPSNWTDWGYVTAEQVARRACGRGNGQSARTDHGTYIQYRQTPNVTPTARRVPKVPSSRDAGNVRVTDADVRAYMDRLGLGSVTLTSAQRVLVLDAMAYAHQLDQYAGKAA